MTSLAHSLKEVFGFDGFRSGQQQTITQLLEDKSSLAIFPTGSGKSLCYQLTALHLPHLTLVVSPLLALMKDQLSFLAKKGIKAASIDSSLTAEQVKQVMSATRTGAIKILMVSVERFKNERFRQFISAIPVSLLVVDEAHCISEWGHNFRPDYLKLPAYCQMLNINLVLLLTATATDKVKKDMAAKFSIAPQHIVQTGFYRQNLDLSVTPVTAANKDQQLLLRLQQLPSCGIVYVTLQHTAEQVASFLCQNGLRASAYHAGFDSDKREHIQRQFMRGSVDMIVATIAFGMGIDKADIRFVIHYDLPKSIENYSQEIGRAGRDGLSSQCITLANLDSLHTLENFVYGDTPELFGIEQVLSTIKSECQQGQWQFHGLSLSNDSNIRQLPLKTLLVQLEILDVIKPLFSFFADIKYKFLSDESKIVESFQGERRQFVSAIFAKTRFKKIWGELDFESLNQAYPCQRSRVISALDYLHDSGHIVLETKKMTEVYQVNSSVLMDPQLATRCQKYFEEKQQSEIKRIEALIDFFVSTHCLSKRLSAYFDEQNTPKNCGHCSVCRGHFAQLKYSVDRVWPSDSHLINYLIELINHMQSRGNDALSDSTLTRFLTGLMVPIFTRQKVKSLAGFGSCEGLRYQNVYQKVTQFRIDSLLK